MNLSPSNNLIWETKKLNKNISFVHTAQKSLAFLNFPQGPVHTRRAKDASQAHRRALAQLHIQHPGRHARRNHPHSHPNPPNPNHSHLLLSTSSPLPARSNRPTPTTTASSTARSSTPCGGSTSSRDWTAPAWNTPSRQRWTSAGRRSSTSSWRSGLPGCARAKTARRSLRLSSPGC